MVRHTAIPMLLALLSCGPAHGLTLRLCTDESSHLPFITPTGEGTVDRLVAEAAREVGITIELRPAPITRCREEIRANAADGFPTTPYTPSLLSFIAFPMKDGEPDPARAVSTTRAVFFRRVGSQADWDGTRLQHLKGKVLVQFGAVLMLDRLAAIGAPIDDSGKTIGANFAKLLAGRGELTVGSEYSGRALMARPEFAGKIEALPIPFTDEPYYLGLSRRFQEEHPQAVERLWEAIARIRRTAAYQAVVRKAMEESARTLKE